MHVNIYIYMHSHTYIHTYIRTHKRTEERVAAQQYEAATAHAQVRMLCQQVTSPSYALSYEGLFVGYEPRLKCLGACVPHLCYRPLTP